MIKLSSILKSAGLIVGSLVAPVVLPAITSAAASAGAVAGGAVVTGIGAAGSIGGLSGTMVAGGNNSEKIYTTEEAAEKLGISIYSLRRHIRAGKINVRVIPGKKGYFLTDAALNAFSDPSKKNIRNEESTSATVDFETGVQIIKESLNNKKITPEFIEETIRGKELECDALRLQLRKLELEKSDDTEFEKQKNEIEIALNLIQLEIQVYKTSLV